MTTKAALHQPAATSGLLGLLAAFSEMISRVFAEAYNRVDDVEPFGL